MFYGNGTFACPGHLLYIIRSRRKIFEEKGIKRRVTVMIMEVEDDERTDVQTSQYYD